MCFFFRSWITEIDGKPEEEAKSLIGLLETTYLISYSIFMFFSGFVAERMDLRFFLSMGMMLSGLLCVLFGIAYPLGIHSIWYLIFIQIVTGMVQSSGWPGVVTAMGNWFGKGKRGLLMGVWNSHTSLGNIVGKMTFTYHKIFYFKLIWETQKEKLKKHPSQQLLFRFDI